MQNARNRQSKEVQLEKAHIEDDGQWEVTEEVRESWSVAKPSQNVSFETSYLPFIFPSSPPDQTSNTADADIAQSLSHNDSTQFKGRRIFRKGIEVHEQNTRPVTEDSTTPHIENDDQEIVGDSENKTSQSTKGKKAVPRLTALSKTKSGETAGELKPGKAIAKSLPTAKLAIFDSSGVGTDLSSSRLLSSTKADKTATFVPANFVKPAGVDDPQQLSSLKTNSACERKRAPDAEQDGPKRKKKKKSSSD